MIRSIKINFIVIFALLSIKCISQNSYINFNDMKTDSLNLRMNFKPKVNFENTTWSNIQDYSNTLPFFCKMEYILEKSSKINLRMRLGDLNYVNYLENKK
jgi:hypothetical protein